MAHLLEYDSCSGASPARSRSPGGIAIDGQLVRAFAEREPQALPWSHLDVDVVIESTGRRMPSAFHAISDALPLSHAVDGMHHLSLKTGASPALWVDIATVLMFAVGALMTGALTLRRPTD